MDICGTDNTRSELTLERYDEWSSKDDLHTASELECVIEFWVLSVRQVQELLIVKLLIV